MYLPVHNTCFVLLQIKSIFKHTHAHKGKRERERTREEGEKEREGREHLRNLFNIFEMLLMIIYSYINRKLIRNSELPHTLKDPA